MDQHDALLAIAVDLTASLGSSDRLSRLVDAVRKAIPCDAAAVLQLDGDELVPVAIHGLASEVLGRRFRLGEHPRLDAVLTRGAPVLFPSDSALPDPYDGLLLANPDGLAEVHACLGCPLVEGDAVIGVLTADALRPGAFDAIDARFLRMLGALAGAAMNTGRLFEALERASRRHLQVARALQREAVTRDGGGRIIGTSAAIQRVREEIALVARSDFAVLITGETGVGKELVARAIHKGSARRDEPHIYVNCAALPETIAESELFGHVRGAFTGADTDRAGKFEVADKGTLFLDEVGELPPSVQPKLLRALQGGEIQRVGSDRVLRVDVRVVAATNRDLPREVDAGRFRADLFHRLNMYPIAVPPLRERHGDIPLLAGFFLDTYRRRLGLGPVRLTEAARRALVAARWPGNVRELDHLLGRAALRAGAGTRRDAPVLVGVEHLQIEVPPPEWATPAAAGEIAAAARATPTLSEAVEELKRTMVSRAVAESGGNWAAAARALGMARGNLHHMARRLGLVAKLT
ncbi:MAG: nitric oxide reductase transcriptional regulator NorR [Deltaproteobacteria bacterium HGW-Deltaproteobacteria-14]|jgi:anaerobic nitric oxide reductase transcription regulator|nr:MAG: nitric oxide reductase transcriptional regulator NorR [Deltaproteobacteria bacterium HGW-Deltaproteobacteria-14]